MTVIAIRPAVPDDAADIAAVHVRSFVAAYSHLPRTRHSAAIGLTDRVSEWRRRLEMADRVTLVATDGRRIDGFAHLGSSPDGDAGGETGHVFSIHVDPDQTGHGTGERLMVAAAASLTTHGYRCATLWVVADNDRARRFYQRLGWTTDGASRREHLAVGDEDGDEVEVVRYRRDLGASG